MTRRRSGGRCLGSVSGSGSVSASDYSAFASTAGSGSRLAEWKSRLLSRLVWFCRLRPQTKCFLSALRKSIGYCTQISISREGDNDCLARVIELKFISNTCIKWFQWNYIPYLLAVLFYLKVNHNCTCNQQRKPLQHLDANWIWPS